MLLFFSLKNASHKEAFFKLNFVKETPVIWVHSTSIPVVEAVFRVFEEYETFFPSKPFLIHHVFEENEDLCKKVGVQKLITINKLIGTLKESVPAEGDIAGIVKSAANKALARQNIRWLCYDVFLKDKGTNVGTTDDNSYTCRSPFTVKALKEQLISKTLEAISESFASEICQGILEHIKAKIKVEIEKEFFDLKVKISPEIFATFAVAIGTVIITLFMPLLGIIFAMATVVVTLILSVDVNSVSWRRNVADQIYETVSKNRTTIEKDILSEIKTMCNETKKELHEVSKQIDDLKKKIGFPDQETCRYNVFIRLFSLFVCL